MKIWICSVDELEKRGWWPDLVRLKLTQSPAKAGVEVGTELGNLPF